MSIGVLVGRFQTDEIHEGHVKLLNYVQQKHPNMIILLGIIDSPANRLYPLNYQVRELMIRQYCPSATILPVFDRADDEVWSKQVDDLIGTVFQGQETILYGGRDSFIPHYKGRFKTQEIYFGDDDSGTANRKQIAQKPRSTADFRAGIIYAMENLMPRIYLTVDIALVKDSKQVLLGRKPHENKFRFPGGFVDFKDESFENAARRELYEETRVTCEAGLTYIGNYSINDWRVKGTDDVKNMTVFYLAPYAFGEPKGSDDLETVQWFDIATCKNEIMEDHKHLLVALQKFMEKGDRG